MWLCKQLASVWNFSGISFWKSHTESLGDELCSLLIRLQLPMNNTFIFACIVGHSWSAFPTIVGASFCSSPSSNHRWLRRDSVKLCTCRSNPTATFTWLVTGRSDSSSLYMEEMKVYATREHSFQIHTTRIYSTDTGMYDQITGLNSSKKKLLINF